MDLLKNIENNFMEKVSCMIKKIYNNKVVSYSILLTLGIFLLELIFKIIMGLNKEEAKTLCFSNKKMLCCDRFVLFLPVIF